MLSQIRRNLQMVHAPTNQPPNTRENTIQRIAAVLWLQYHQEQGQPFKQMHSAPAHETRRFYDMAEFCLAWFLDEDRREAALMCMADTLCVYRSGLGIDEHPRDQQAGWRKLAISVTNTLALNMKDNPPDPHYRDRMSRLSDALEQEENRNAAI